jgi:hypothetical protein
MNNQPQERCELCGIELQRPQLGRTWGNLGTLKGLCRNCCDRLGGGAYSARIVVQEAKAIAARKAVR